MFTKQLALFTLIVTLCVPALVYGADYAPLVGIPGVDPNADFSGYINSLYILSISVAALLAVIKIIIAGVKWMLTDVVTSKGEAKKDIYGAVIGLLIVLAAVLILTVINPNLTNVKIIFDPVSPISLPTVVKVGKTLTEPKTTTPIGATGSQVVSIPNTASTEQKMLFVKDCNNQANSKSYHLSSSEVRCITTGATENSQVMRYCSTPDCTTVYHNIIKECTDKNGTFVPETAPAVKNFALCIYPK